MNIRIIPFGLAIYLMLAVNVHAGSPLKTVETEVRNLLKVLSDPNLAGEEGKAQKIAQMRVISENIFDYTRLSKFVLGINWKKLNADQQKEFIRLFKKLLENVYMDRLLAYQGEKVIFTKETLISDQKAEVYSHIQTADKQIPISYKLFKSADTWKAYDLIIEGVSMVKNYRTQFQKILSDKSPKEMLAILKEKA